VVGSVGCGGPGRHTGRSAGPDRSDHWHHRASRTMAGSLRGADGRF